ncbi:hypothetical protein [Mesotoga prima]|uniref:hypothetical protein n=1 Tax=Mesotoga prima TaxID=1184387 RepID=UPI002B517797|nr:hypothetical protein [Mesotoga prima]HOZ98660.1 hypothetical protein [Mesotoga prima]
MKKLLILIVVFFCVVTVAMNPFQLQTGGNGILAVEYDSGFGSPSDLYGITNSAFSTHFVELTTVASPSSNQRALYLHLFEDSDDGMAGMLQYYMDTENASNVRSLSYTVSGALGPFTAYGADFELNMTTATATTYGVSVRGGITGKAYELIEYIVSFSSDLWNSGSSVSSVDLLAGIRFVPDPFMIGLELGTREGMAIKYLGLSTQYTYNNLFSARAGVSMNADLLSNIDFIVGGGMEVRVGDMLITAGIGTNLTNKIESFSFSRNWSVGLLGRW